MKWMNFIPALVWMIVILLVMLRDADRGKMTQATVDYWASFYILGLVLWLVIGGLLCL